MSAGSSRGGSFRGHCGSDGHSSYLNGEIEKKEAAAKAVSVGAAGYAGDAAGAVASSLAASVVSSGLDAATVTTIDGTVAGSAIGGAAIAAAPVVVPFASSVAVGGLVSGWVGSVSTTFFPGFPIDREIHCSTVSSAVFRGAEYPSCTRIRKGFMVDFGVEYGLRQEVMADFEGF